MADLTISQPDGAGTADANEALDEAWIGQEVELTLSAGVEYEHSILDKPADSAITLGTPTAQTATYTPDEACANRSVLTRSRVRVGTTWSTFDKVVRFTKDATGADVNFGLVQPAKGEVPAMGNAGGTTRGYADTLDRNQDRIVSALQNPTTEILELSAATVDLEASRTHELSGAVATANLPDPSTCRGEAIILYLVDALTVTINRFGSELINGVAADGTADVPYQFYTLMSNGTDWIMNPL